MTRNPVRDREEFSAAYWSSILNAHTQEAIVSGCVPTLGTGDFEIDIASGEAHVGGSIVAVGAQTVTLSTADSDDRVDLVTVDAGGTAAVVEGTPADPPLAPDIPDGEVLVAVMLVEGGAASLSSAGSELDDYRTIYEASPTFRDVEAESVSTGGASIGQRLDAAVYDGAIGREQIQNAIDDLPPTGGQVFVGPGGPDDVSASTGSLSEREGSAWEIDQPLRLPSNSTLILANAYVFLADSTDNNIIRNDNANSGDATRDENVSIVGVGSPIVDGNGTNQTDNITGERWKETPIRFNKVDNYSIVGLTLREPNSWTIVPEDTEDGRIHNINFDCSGANDNQDGVHVVGPANDITVSQITGQFGDDVCVANARNDPVQGINGGGDVLNVIFSDVTARNMAQSGILRTAASAEHTLNGVRLENATWTNDGNSSKPAINIGGGGDPPADNHKNISVDGLTAETNKADPAVIYAQFSDAKGVTLSGITSENGTRLFDNNFNKSPQLTITECDVTLADGEPESEGMIRFRGGNVIIEETSIDNVVLRADNSVDTRAIRVQNYDSINGVNISARLVLFDTGVQVEAAGGSVGRAHFDGITMRAVNTEWDVTPEAVSQNGVAEETSDAEEPQGDYDVGTTVDFTDSGDGSGTGLYQLMPDGTWVQIGT